MIGVADPGIPGVVPIPLDEDHFSICKPASRERPAVQAGATVRQGVPDKPLVTPLRGSPGAWWGPRRSRRGSSSGRGRPRCIGKPGPGSMTREIYEWFAANLHRVREPSLRHYVRAKEFKAAKMDWTEVLTPSEPRIAGPGSRPSCLPCHLRAARRHGPRRWSTRAVVAGRPSSTTADSSLARTGAKYKCGIRGDAAVAPGAVRFSGHTSVK